MDWMPAADAARTYAHIINEEMAFRGRPIHRAAVYNALRLPAFRSDESQHSRPDLIPDLPNFGRWTTLRIRKVPIKSPDAGHDRALLATAHRDQYLRLRGDRIGQVSRLRVRNVDADFVHRADNFSVRRVRRLRTGGYRASLSRIGEHVEPGGGHL